MHSTATTNNKIMHAFNKAKTSYDLHSELQQQVGSTLIQALLPFHSQLHTLIDLGCGTGHPTEELAQTFSQASIHAIDIAEALLTVARTRLAHYPVQLTQADFNDLSSINQTFDLAFSNMALHWSPDMGATFLSLKSILNQQGLLAFTIPLQGTCQEMANHFATNSFVSSDHICSLLTAAGYELISVNIDTLHCSFANTLAALQSFKHVGANCVKQRMIKSLRGKSFLQQIQLHQLTYVIGFFIAKKIHHVV